MAGAQHEEFSYDTFSATRKNFTSDNFNLALGSSKDQETGAATWAETLRSVYGRLSYVYNDRYIVEINGRYDGTSRFAPGHRWGLFTGYSAAWRLSEEDFIKDLNIFDQLKIRGSWGKWVIVRGSDVMTIFRLLTSVRIGLIHSTKRRRVSRHLPTWSLWHVLGRNWK